ncbi:PCNA-interacting partner isoform X2 [Narcine bancroftii]|uniref:PCNA-interacting partner isoform X2 n=1 Tax=Narcine bancroftii TaxID=1343680 RepID=UPI003830FE6D
MNSGQRRVLELIRRFRREWCRVPERERTIVCGAENMLLVLQLAMAQINKETLGEFTIVLSELLLMWKCLLRGKLGLRSESTGLPEGYDKVRGMYQSLLSRSNSVDLIDVYRICADQNAVDDIGEMLPADELLDFITGSPENIVPSAPPSPATERCQSILEMVPLWRKLLCDYLSLLVNSKSDLALACIFNLPERGLGRAAFTHLRHAASSKQTSLYLAATSFIRSLELGGKSYTPSADHPMMPSVKGLMDLVHFVDQLQEIMGETSDSSIAGCQILSMITRRLLKGTSSESPLYLAGEKVRQELTARITDVVNGLDITVGGGSTSISPAQPKAYTINHGTAYGGRRTIKAFLAVLDEEACRPSRGQVELLYSLEEHTNPLGIPCMLTMFRSPKQSSGLSPKTLQHRSSRLYQESSRMKLKPTVIKSQFSCTYKEENTAKDCPMFDQTLACVRPRPTLFSSISRDHGLADAQKTESASEVKCWPQFMNGGTGTELWTTHRKLQVPGSGATQILLEELSESNGVSGREMVNVVGWNPLSGLRV